MSNDRNIHQSVLHLAPTHDFFSPPGASENMSKENGTAEKHKHKRTRRACLNCRRKKTRCPGELPACSFCVRLDQPCQYAESLQGKGRSLSRVLSNNKEDIPYSDLIARVAQLEEMVRMPAQLDMANSSEQRVSQQGPETFLPSNAWAFMGSSLVNECPPAGAELTESLGDSINIFPLSTSLIRLAVDAFFLHAHNQPYSFFCESRFRQRVIDGSIADHVLLAVVASAARFMEDRYSNSDLGALCAQLSWNLLSKHLHSDTEADLGFVQATTLLAMLDFTGCRSRTAWKKIGTAARIAQDLKYMFEPDSCFPVQEQEEQRRTFWSIYMLDGLATCGRARPPVFHEHSCRLNLPCTEMSFQLDLHEKSQSLDQAFSEVDLTNGRTDVSPFARVILITTILSRVSQYIVQDVNFRTEKPPWSSSSDYAVISSSLFNFEFQAGMQRPLQEALDMDGLFMGEVVGHSTEHIVFYYALYHLTQCVLNHHFLLRRRLRPYSSRVPPIFTSRAFKTCREHAQSLTALLDDAHRLGCRLRSSFLGYCALIAGTINSLYRYDQDPNIRSQSAVALAKNIEFLTRHSQYWNNAELMLEELRRFDEEASMFQSLIIPEIIELNFDPATIERLYDLSDYNVVSRHHGNVETATALLSDFEIRQVLTSFRTTPEEWMQSPSDHNSIFMDDNEILGSQISGLSDHNGLCTSQFLTMVPEVGIRSHASQGASGLMSNQMF